MKKQRSPLVPCPHCGTRSIIRSSEQISPLVREADYRCDNIACGHTFVVELAIVRTIVPSACPRAGIHLPRGNPNLGPRRAPVPANDDTRSPANDPGPLTPAAADMSG